MTRPSGLDTPSLSSRVLINGIGNLLPPLSSLIIAPILAQSLGVVGRGELAAATAPYLLAVAIATLGLPEAVTHAVARFPDLCGRLVRRTLWIVFLSGLIATGLVYLLSPILSAGDNELERLIALAGVATAPALVVALLRGAASGLNAWKLVAGERALTGIVRVLGIVLLAITAELTPFSAAMCLAIAPVFAGLVYVWMPRPIASTALAGGGLKPGTRKRDLLWYGSRVWFGSVSGILLLRLDQAVMAPLSSPYQLGLYAIAVNVSEVPLIVNTAVREVMFTSDAAENDNNRLVSAARISNFACAVIGVFMASTLILWVPFVFGSEFTAAIPAMLILIFAVVLGTPGSIAGAALSARGAPELRSLSLTLACIFSVALLLFLVPIWGAVGAATATLLGNLIASQGNIIFFQRRHGVAWQSFYGIRKSDFAVMGAVLRRLRSSS